MFKIHVSCEHKPNGKNGEKLFKHLCEVNDITFDGYVIYTKHIGYNKLSISGKVSNDELTNSELQRTVYLLVTDLKQLLYATEFDYQAETSSLLDDITRYLSKFKK